VVLFTSMPTDLISSAIFAVGEYSLFFDRVSGPFHVSHLKQEGLIL